MEYINNLLDGNVDPNLIFVVVILLHLLVISIIVAFVVYRNNRHKQREAIITDTIDALLADYEHEETNPSLNVVDTANSEVTSILNEPIIKNLNQLSSKRFADYLEEYFREANYNTIAIPHQTKIKHTPHLIISKDSKRGVVLTHKPPTGVTGLPVIRGYYERNISKIAKTDSLILITTGHLSPKALDYIKHLTRPIIIINGQQLATSIQQMDLRQP